MRPTVWMVVGCSVLALTQDIGCQHEDHEMCDELCKTDSSWYGNCAKWDGRDFQCHCFPYQAPLDSSVCQTVKKTCEDRCVAQTGQSGYCYPQPSSILPKGIPRCRCFANNTPIDLNVR